MSLGPRLRSRAGVTGGPRREHFIDAGLSLDLDFTAPSTQTLPASVAAATAICGRTFSETWTFTAASGNQASSTGVNAFAVLNPPRYQATFPVWDGASMLATDAIEWKGTATTNYMVLLSAAAYDLSQSLTWVFYGRLLRAPAAARSWLGKRTGAATAGYEIRVSTTGRPELHVGDGTNTTASVAPTSGTEELDGFANGSPQWWAFKMDLTAGTSQILGLRAAGTAVAMPVGAKTNAGNVKLGGAAYMFDCELLQIAWCGVLVGAEAEAFDLAALNALDTTARAPSSLARYDRKSVCSPRVAYETGFGVRVQHLHGSQQSTGLAHFPHLYHPSATLSAQKLAAYFARGVCETTNRQKRNLFTYSDNLTHANWTKASMTAAAGVGTAAFEDPSGFTGATLLTATLANATIYQTKTVEANQAHYLSFYVRRSGGSDVSLVLRAVNNDTTATIASASRTATSEWTRIELVAQDLTATNIRYELEIVANGAAIYATFAQLERGFVSEYQAQRGTLIDRKAANYYVDNAPGYLDPRAGKVEIVAVAYYDDTYALEDQYVFSTDTTPGVLNGGRILLQVSDPNGGGIPAAYDTDFQIYDAAGTLRRQIGGANIDRNAEITYTLQWDSRGGAIPGTGGASAALDQTGSAQSTTGATPGPGSWSMPLSVPRLYPGTRYSYGDSLNQQAHFEGGIERVRIWR